VNRKRNINIAILATIVKIKRFGINEETGKLEERNIKIQ